MVGRLRVDVTERIVVDNSGNAECARTYTFNNPNSGPQRLPRLISIDLPAEADVTAEPRFDPPRDLRPAIKPGAFHKELSIGVRDLVIPARTQARLRVQYAWPGFI